MPKNPLDNMQIIGMTKYIVKHWSGRYTKHAVKDPIQLDFEGSVQEGMNHLVTKVHHSDSPDDADYLQYSFLDPLDQLRQTSQDQLNPEISF